MNTVRKTYHAFKEKDDRWISAEEVRKNPDLFPGYNKIKCHIVFDINLDGHFTQKARFVADRLKVNIPRSCSYSYVVSRESVCIAFLLAGLNGLDVNSCDISGAYLNSPSGELCFFEAGLECGKGLKGTAMVIDQALYSLKSSGKAWQEFF